MAFLFPTDHAPDNDLKIVIAPHTIARAKGDQRLEVLSELAHEFVHYVLILQENGWNHDRPKMINNRSHHCDPEFMRLTRHVGEVIWQAYHSSNLVRSVDQMVQLSCWRDGYNLGAYNRMHKETLGLIAQ
jgi:hypothetical protein